MTAHYGPHLAPHLSVQAAESRLTTSQTQLAESAAKISQLELDVRRLEREKNRLKQTCVSPGWSNRYEISF